MRNHIFKTIIIAVVLSVVFFSCGKNGEKEIRSLNSREVPVPYTITCVKSSNDKNIVFIGTDIGELLVYDIFKNNYISFNVDENVIYDVLHQRVSEKDSIGNLWILSRDGGISKIPYNHIKNELKFSERIRFEIDGLKPDEAFYSAYKADTMNGELYVGTSSGLYKKMLNRDTSPLKRLDGDGRVKQVLCCSEKNHVFYSVDDNLKVCNGGEAEVSIVVSSENGIKPFQDYTANSKSRAIGLLTSSGEIYHKDILASKLLSLPNKSILIDCVWNQKTKSTWFVTSSEVIFEDLDGGIRKTNISNVSRTNALITENYFIVPCDNSLRLFPIHDLGGKDLISNVSNPIGNLYFLLSSDYSLYSYNSPEEKKSKKEAIKVGELQCPGDRILDFKATKNFLWFSTSREIFMTDHSGKNKKVVASIVELENKYKDKNDEIQTFFCRTDSLGNEVGLYWSARKIFLYSGLSGAMQDTSSPVSILNSDSLGRDKSIYVNGIVEKDSFLVVTTLNHGIFKGTLGMNGLSKMEKVNGSDKKNIGNPRGIILICGEHKGDHNYYIQTSKGIYCYNDRKDSLNMISKVSDQICKAIISDGKKNGYVLGIRGLHSFSPKEKDIQYSFTDIYFRPQAFSVDGYQIVFAADKGVYEMDYIDKSLSLVDLPLTPERNIQPKSKKDVYNEIGFYLLLVVFFVVGGIVIWLVVREKIPENFKEDIPIQKKPSEEMPEWVDELDIKDVIFNNYEAGLNRLNLVLKKDEILLTPDDKEFIKGSKILINSVLQSYFSKSLKYLNFPKDTDMHYILAMGLVRHVKCADLVKLELKDSNNKLVDRNNIYQWRLRIRESLKKMKEVISSGETGVKYMPIIDKLIENLHSKGKQ